VTNTYIRILSWFMIFLLITPLGAMPQDTGESVPSANFTKEELDQMLAPVALYPDSLLSQILMASTYPIEVVEADRWIKQNPNLTGDQLDEALKYKDWDVSVKSLCHFPTVLSAMNQNLDETTRLGNAFLNQQQDVMDTVQELRAKAQAQGNLNTTAQQRIIVQQGVTEIVPADPQVIYVPAYDPAVVYGSWWYPGYPPYVWYPEAAVIGGIISFGVGFFVGAAVGSWSGFDWGHHDVNIDIHRTTVFNNINIHNVQGGWQRWGHNPEHRRGVAYWNNATSQRFGRSPAQSMESRRQFSGYGERGNSTQNLQQKQFKQGGGGGGSVSGTRGGGHDSAFSGINNWNSEHTASQRGQASHTQSFGGGGHGGGGSHSGGNQKNQKGH